MDDTDRRILETGHLPAHQRMKVAAELGIGFVRATQRLLQLIDDPEAERECPIQVHRLQRQRDAMRGGRPVRRRTSVRL